MYYTLFLEHQDESCEGSNIPLKREPKPCRSPDFLSPLSSAFHTSNNGNNNNNTILRLFF